MPYLLNEMETDASSDHPPSSTNRAIFLSAAAGEVSLLSAAVVFPTKSTLAQGACVAIVISGQGHGGITP
jgi:hypothetical protein